MERSKKELPYILNDIIARVENENYWFHLIGDKETLNDIDKDIKELSDKIDILKIKRNEIYNAIECCKAKDKEFLNFVKHLKNGKK